MLYAYIITFTLGLLKGNFVPGNYDPNKIEYPLTWNASKKDFLRKCLRKRFFSLYIIFFF